MAVVCAWLGAGFPAVASGAAAWSTPVAAPCPASGPPSVLFPSEKPNRPSGPGALVWPGAEACPGGAGARVQSIAEGAAPSAPTLPRSGSGAPIAPVGAISTAAAPHGQIAISGAGPRPRREELLVQGRADGRFRAQIEGGPLRPPGTLATAYLGDLALLASTAGPAGGLAIRIERWFANVPGRERTASSGGVGAVTAATVAMDFRSDAIAAWAQSGSVWVADLPARGRPRPARRLGPSGTRTRIVALLSDDDRGMVMWSASTGTTTSVWLDYSKTGPRFGPPQLLERYAAPASAPAPAGSPQLIRLSSESVMSAWAGVEAGRWVVRTAPIDQRGLRTVSTLASPGGDELLQALAPGPDGDAFLLTEEPRAGFPPVATVQPDPAATEELLATRGSEAAGRTAFGPLEPVATIPPASVPTIAAEPGTDRAVAAWQGADGLVRYSIRTPGNPG